MTKTTNTAASVLQRMAQLKNEFDATDTRPRAHVKKGSVEIFKRVKSSESLGERVVNHLTRHSQRANAVKLVEAVLKDVESVLSPAARGDIATRSSLDHERRYLGEQPSGKGLQKTIENLQELLKTDMEQNPPVPTRKPTRAPRTVRPRLTTRTSKATRPEWAGKGPSTVAGRATDRPALSKTTPPKMTKRSAAPGGRAAVPMTAQGNAVPARSPGKAKPVAPLHAAAPDLASQWEELNKFATGLLDWAELLSHAFTPSRAHFENDGVEGHTHKISTERTRAGVQAFQKFLHKVDGMTSEGIDAEWKKLNAKGKKSAEEFTAAEKNGIRHFASQLVANPAAGGSFSWVAGALAIAKIVVAEPVPPSTRIPRPVR
jgi:hypothetical protein